MSSEAAVMTTHAGSAERPAPRVLIVGVDAPGGLMSSFARAFRRQGASVREYCVMKGGYDSPFGQLATRVLWRVASGPMTRRANARIVRGTSGLRADLVLVLKGHFLLRETVGALRRGTGGIVVNFYPDDPFGADRSNALVGGVDVLAAYDRCYTFAKHLIAEYHRRGIAEVAWLPFARDVDQHSPVPTVEPPEFDAVFVGNLDAERVRWLEPVARQARLAIFGEHTRAAVPQGSPLRSATFLAAAYEGALAHALTRGAASLNVMRPQNRLSHNMRSYESLACGAFTISQWTPELESMFRAGEEVVFARDPEEMAALVQHWRERPADRRRIALRGFERVADDSYDARARTLLQTISTAVGARP